MSPATTGYTAAPPEQPQHPAQQVYREDPAGQSYVKTYTDNYNMGSEDATASQSDTYYRQPTGRRAFSGRPSRWSRTPTCHEGPTETRGRTVSILLACEDIAIDDQTLVLKADTPPLVPHVENKNPGEAPAPQGSRIRERAHPFHRFHSHHSLSFQYLAFTPFLIIEDWSHKDSDQENPLFSCSSCCDYHWANIEVYDGSHINYLVLIPVYIGIILYIPIHTYFVTQITPKLWR